MLYVCGIGNFMSIGRGNLRGVSHIEQRQDLTERRVSHMTLARVSQKAGTHKRQRMKENAISQKAGSHTWQSLTEGWVS